MSDEKKTEKKPSKSSKQILLVLAKKIKIMDEQLMSQRLLVDELEDRLIEIENRVYDDKDVFFKSEFDWE